MNLFERYLNGECRQVHLDIMVLGDSAFDEEIFKEIDKVYTETFLRVGRNFEIVYRELTKFNYDFDAGMRNKAINYKLNHNLSERSQIFEVIRGQLLKIGYVPKSLEYFYKLIGSIDLAWNINSTKDILWPEADPLQIIFLDEQLEAINDNYCEEVFENCFNENISGIGYIEISADYLHKDNISGGECYVVNLTNKKSIDGVVLNEGRNCYFIDYLRIAFENCGFLRDGNYRNSESWTKFYGVVKPQMKFF